MRQLHRRRAVLGAMIGVGLTPLPGFAGSAAASNIEMATQPLLSPRRHAFVSSTGFGHATMRSATSASVSTRRILAVPIASGDVLGPPYAQPFQIRQWLPGVGTGFDGPDAEPNGIMDFRGFAALAYTSGTATDKRGRTYTAQPDIRAYQGEYVKVDGGHARGTFVEI